MRNLSSLEWAKQAAREHVVSLGSSRGSRLPPTGLKRARDILKRARRSDPDAAYLLKVAVSNPDIREDFTERKVLLKEIEKRVQEGRMPRWILSGAMYLSTQKLREAIIKYRNPAEKVYRVFAVERPHGILGYTTGEEWASVFRVSASSKAEATRIIRGKGLRVLRVVLLLANPLTEESRRVFLMYARDSRNWGGTPLVGGNVGGTKEERGNLTQLKRAGLITTFRSDGEMWIHFTEKGRQYAESLGIEIPLSENPFAEALITGLGVGTGFTAARLAVNRVLQTYKRR